MNRVAYDIVEAGTIEWKRGSKGSEPPAETTIAPAQGRHRSSLQTTGRHHSVVAEPSVLVVPRVLDASSGGDLGDRAGSACTIVSEPGRGGRDRRQKGAGRADRRQAVGSQHHRRRPWAGSTKPGPSCSTGRGRHRRRQKRVDAANRELACASRSKQLRRRRVPNDSSSAPRAPLAGEGRVGRQVSTGRWPRPTG